MITAKPYFQFSNHFIQDYEIINGIILIANAESSAPFGFMGEIQVSNKNSYESLDPHIMPFENNIDTAIENCFIFIGNHAEKSYFINATCLKIYGGVELEKLRDNLFNKE